MIASVALSVLLVSTPLFEDVTASAGLDPIRFASGFLPSTAASAWVDLDDDGDIDLLLGGDEFGMQAWLNSGAPDFTFTDASAAYGVDELTGVIAIAVVRDGSSPTMWVTRYGTDGEAPELQLWTLPAGEEPEHRVRWLPPYLLSFGDLDGDGDHDLVASAAIDCVPFSNELSGLYAWSQHFGTWSPRVDDDWPALGCLSVPSVSDYGGDQSPDVVYTSDYGLQHTPTSVVNAQGGVDRSLPRVYGMGVGVGDLDGDQISDYVFTSIRDDALWLSAGGWHRGDLPPGGAFGSDGVRVKWGASLFDADNDGALEIYIGAGRLLSSPLYQNAALQKSLLYSMGAEVGTTAGVASESRDTTVGTADFDQDGRLDLLVGATDSWQLLRNTTDESGHYLQVVIDDAPGTTGLATCGDRTVHAEYSGARAGAQDAPMLHFGLGDCDTPTDVVIRWPWGGTATRTAVEVDSRITVSRIPPVRVQPNTVSVGKAYRITYRGPGSSVSWDGEALENVDEDEWTLVLDAAEPGDRRVRLEVDGEPLQFAPWVRVYSPSSVVWSVDPSPIRRGGEHRLTATADPSLEAITVGADGATVSTIDTTAGRWVGRLNVPIDADDITITARRGSAAVGEPWLVTPVPGVDAERTEVRVERTDDGRARVLLLPVDALGGYYLFQPEFVTVTAGDGSVHSVSAGGLSEWEATVPWGGQLRVHIDGVELPAIDTDALDAPRDADPDSSVFFALYERARPDGDDLVVLVYRPLDANGQPVEVASEPPLFLEGMRWLDSAEPYCQALPDDPACAPTPPLGRWREESLDGTPFLITRVEAINGASAGAAYLGDERALVTRVDLHDTPRATPTDRSEARWDDAVGWLTIEPRDADGHLIGSGVSVAVETDPPSEARVVYVGFGRYVRPGAFRSARVTIGDGEDEVAIELTGSLPPEETGGCSQGPTSPPYSGHATGLLFLVLAVVYRVRRRFGT